MYEKLERLIRSHESKKDRKKRQTVIYNAT